MAIGNRVAMLALAAGFCLATGSDAPEPGITAGPRPKTLEAYGDIDKTCREWTDGCATCARRENGTPGCSTPGIACQPGALTCQRKADTSAPTESTSQPPPK